MKNKKVKKCKHKWIGVSLASGYMGLNQYIAMYCEKCGETKKSYLKT